MTKVGALLIIILIIGCGVFVRGQFRPNLVKEIEQHQQDHHTNDVNAILEKHLNKGMDKTSVISYFKSEGFSVYPPHKPTTSGDQYIAHYSYGWWLFGTVYKVFLEFRDDKLFEFSTEVKNEST